MKIAQYIVSGFSMIIFGIMIYYAFLNRDFFKAKQKVDSFKISNEKKVLVNFYLDSIFYDKNENKPFIKTYPVDNSLPLESLSNKKIDEIIKDYSDL